MLQRVFLLSLLLCTGSQQISNPQAFSPTGKSLILAVPKLSLCLSGSAASMSPVASAAARSALRRAVTMSVWGRRRMEPAVPGKAQCTRQRWLFPCLGAWLSTDKSSAKLKLEP